jgi:tRNA threonylcarbamoyladenosine biosynthesis protein TsaB
MWLGLLPQTEAGGSDGGIYAECNAVLILALETSSQAGSAAVLNFQDGQSAACDNVLSQRVLASDFRSAQTLIPAIAEVLSQAGRVPKDVNLVAVTVGPGSFTGLRVGVTAAKTFAYATGCECLGVDTLEAIAEQAPGDGAGEIHAVLDAQRKELFLARFRRQAKQLLRLDENRIVPAERWLTALAPGNVVTGNGVHGLIDRLPAGVVVVDETLREPQAATVGRLAWRHYQAGQRGDLWKLAPVYLRPSAAEEKVGQVCNLPRTQ